MRYRMHPVKYVDDGVAGESQLEVCAPDDPDLAYWSIYDLERNGDGTMRWLADFARDEKLTAQRVFKALNQCADRPQPGPHRSYAARSRTSP